MPMAIFGKKSLPEKKRENLARAQENLKAGRAQVSHFPLVIYLEPASVCNLACPMCPVAMGASDYQYQDKFLDHHLIEAMEEPLRSALRCFMSGGGEPFLHPYFMTLLELVRTYQPEIIFNTNGTRINRETALYLVKLSINTISFSIDAVSPEKYRAIRKGAELDQVLEAIILIRSEKKKLGVEKPYLNMQFTLMKENLEELKATVQFAYSLGINHLVIEPLSPIFSRDQTYREFFQNNYVPPDPELTATLKKLKAQAKTRLSFSSHYLEQSRFPLRCIQPWINFGVRTDARIFLCCGTNEKMGWLRPGKEESGKREEGKETGTEGRKYADFQEIWNGPAYQEFRAGIASGKYPESCQLCLEEARSPWFNSELLGQ